MPKKNQVRPVEVDNHGNKRWRVFVPKAIAGGKRKTKWFESKTKALEFCKTLEIDQAAKLKGFTGLNLEERALISSMISKVGSVHRLALAVDFFIRHNPSQSRTISELANECFTVKISDENSKRYLSSLKNTFRRFSESFANVPAHEITASQIHEWLNGGGWEPVTRVAYLKDIRTLFSFALKRKYVSFNPGLDVDWPKVSRKPPGIFTPEQLETLFDALQKHDPGLIPLVAMVSFNGLRPEAEAEKVESSFVSETHIDIPPEFTKNNHRRLVELLPITKVWLAVPGAEFKPVNWQKRLRVVRRKAGLSWFHDVLRHSFCSYSVAIHGISKTAEMADNSERVLKHHYLERVPRLSAEKFFQILPK